MHTPQFRAFAVSLSMLLILGFSIFQKKLVWNKSDEVRVSNILTRLPEIEWKGLGSRGDSIKSTDYLLSSAGLVVHFWGTWCGPCEAELPTFVEFASRYEARRVQFVFVAVNDEKTKVKKFIKRFKKFNSSNIHWVMDTSTSGLSSFGTLKVPETYVFDKEGFHLFKFVGPQSWLTSGHEQRLNQALKI